MPDVMDQGFAVEKGMRWVLAHVEQSMRRTGSWECPLEDNAFSWPGSRTKRALSLAIEEFRWETFTI
jgi:hypothetical protein